MANLETARPTCLAADPDAVQTPTRIGMATAARLCPSIRGGRPVHPATVTRWIAKGVRLQDGTLLKLAAKRFPGGWATTRADLDEFVNALTVDRTSTPQPAVEAAPAPRTPTARRRQPAEVKAELDLAGY